MERCGMARAKINLLLEVVGRRADGYHLIDGVMQSLALGDPMCVTWDGTGEGVALRLTNGGELPTDRGNLAYRAAEAFLAESGLGGRVTVELEKRIPIAGGLAGGSSDAACVLRLLNRMAGKRALTEDRLAALAAGLGADVPFCLLSSGGAMRTQGIGEVLTAVPPLPPCTVLVARAGEGVSTPWAYAALDAAHASDELSEVEGVLAALRSGDLRQIAAACRNVFESVVMPVRPAVCRLKEQMREAGALVSMMSGSGPSVFGLFEDRAAAEALCLRLRAEGAVAFVTEPAATNAEQI